MRWISKASVRHPIFTIAVVIGIAVPALIQFLSLKPDNSSRIWFSSDSQIYAKYSAFVDSFSDDVSINIVYKVPDLFTLEQIEINRRLTQRLEKLSNVRKISSLTNAKVLVNNGMRLAWVPVIPVSSVDMERLRRNCLSNPLIKNRWLSGDAEATVIVLSLKQVNDVQIQRTIDEVNDVLEHTTFNKNNYMLAGLIPILHEMDRVSRSETNQYLGTNIVVILVLLTVAFRSLLLSILVVVVASTASIIAVGTYALMGNTANLISGIMPLLILIIGVADAVHVVTHFRTHLARGLHTNTAIIRAMKTAYRPCWYTSVTTALAFLAFTISDIPPLITLGAYTAAAIAIPFILSFTVLPALLLMAYKRSPKASKVTVARLGTQKNYYQLYIDYLFRQRHVIAIVFMGIAIVSAFGLLRVQFQTDQIQYLRTDNTVRQAVESVQQWFGGAVYPIEIVLQGNKHEVFLNKQVLLELDKIQNNIHMLEPVRQVFSPMDILKHVYHIISDGSDFRLNNMSPKMIKQIFKQSEQGSERFIALEKNQYRISVKNRWLSNEELDLLIAEINQLLEPLTRLGVSYHVTGQAVLNTDLNNRLINSQFSSFSISIVLVFLMMLLMFKKVSTALLAMLPNILPVVVTLGLMGWLGVKLDVATILIAAVSLGIAIDDTIHLLNAYVKKRDSGLSVNNALTASLLSMGKPILITSLVLICGFVSMTLSTFVPLVYLGIFFSLNILVAYIADIIIIPSLLSLRTSQNDSSK